MLGPINVGAYPNGPVKLLVGWPAGGPVDVSARYLAGELSKTLGAPVVVENKPGANGMLAVEMMLSQPRDGQTLLLCTHYETLNTVMYRSVKYKIDDLAAVSLIARYYLYFAVSAKSDYRSLQDLIDHARRSPGKLSYGHSGPGSTQDMLMRQLGDLTKTRMVSVPFRGAPPALLELVAGRIDSFLSPSSSVIPMAAAGQVRLLATTSPKRLPVTPDVPTFEELGFPLNLYGWLGVCAPSGTPVAVLENLNAQVTAVTRRSEYRSMIEATGQIAESTSAAELRTIMSAMTEEIADLVGKYGIKVE
jgi:tripartite-type tricarboxylate transporter receptor subunit TctC